MVHFEGSESFAEPPAVVYPKLADAGFLVGCLPDAEVSSASADRAVWKLKPKLAFIAGAIETTLAVVGREPESTASFEVFGKGVGATSTVKADLRFTAEGTGTRIDWTGDVVALTGLLKLVPKGLIQATAQNIVAEVWAAVRGRV